MKLLTGYRGFVGSRLAAGLTDFHGIDVRDGYNLISCELPKDVDLIYHLASQSSVEASWHDPIHDSDNLKMAIRLVHKYPDTRIIYTNSSSSVDRSSPYGFSKWAVAEYLKQFHKNYVICTLPNVYGSGGRSVVDIFKGRTIVKIFGDGEQLRDYVHVDDIVEGLKKAKDWPVGEYFLGSGIGTTLNQLADGKVIMYEEARKESRDSVLKNTTPPGEWKPKINILDYMKA